LFCEDITNLPRYLVADTSTAPIGENVMRLFALILAALLTLAVLVPSAAVAQDGYRVRTGDVLSIEVVEDPGLNRRALVSPDGRISMPLAGSIRAQGRTIEDIQADLAGRLASNFAATPTVFVGIDSVAERRAAAPSAPAVAPTIDIYVLGEAAKPGRISVAPGTTVLQLFAEIGGFSKFAAVKRIQLRRTEGGQETVYGINYRDIESGQSRVGATVLRDGDVIVVPQRQLFE
jgi:polysaccharide biosynthesis/export protein